MARFDSAIALAKRLIAKNGETATLRSFTAAATPDPAKPWEPGANSAVDQTVYGVFLDYEQKYIDGTVVMSGDQKMFMPSTTSAGGALTPEPDVDGLILRGTDEWKIIDAKPLNPNGQTIMFELQVRE